MTFGERLRQLREERGLTRGARLRERGAVRDDPRLRDRAAVAGPGRDAQAGPGASVDCTAFAECEDLAGEEPEPEKPALRPKKGKKA
jgi:transcriptional regulator with XRE-family HTH domain